MSNNTTNKDRNDENYIDNNDVKLQEEATSKDNSKSPDENPKENETIIIGSDDNINDQQQKETSSIKSGEAAQQTPNNLSETTSPKASCSYQDFGKTNKTKQKLDSVN